MKKRLVQLIILLIVLALAVCAATQIAWANPKHQQLRVFVLGDSLSDPGNLYELTLESFGGPENALPPSPPYARTFSNGPVWTKYLGDKLGVEVDSLAYGGAMTGEYVITSRGSFTNYLSFEHGLPPLPGVQDEIDILLAEEHHLNPKALYVIWAGANDFFFGLDLQFQQVETLDSILAQALENIPDIVCRLGKAGAKHFAVVNLPDIGLSPFATSPLQPPGTAELISQKTAQFNRDLRKALAALPKGCADTLVVLDTFRFLRQVVRHPEAYGLENVTDSCLYSLGPGADCSGYLFWDDVHPTTAGHALLADHFVDEFCGCNLHYQYSRGHSHWGLQPPLNWRELCHGVR